MKLSTLPVRAAVIEPGSGLCFIVAAQNHPGYGGTTLLCERIAGIACFDASEPDSAGKSVFERVGDFGRNNYPLSNIHRWLNSNAETGWYTPSHHGDTPPETGRLFYNEQPYIQKPGFLSGFSKPFLSAMREVEVPVVVRTKKGEGELTGVPAKVFLPSRTEVGKGDENGVAEGLMFPLFHDYTIFKAKPADELMMLHGRSLNPPREGAPNDAAQIFDPKYGWMYWMRTANLLYAFLVRFASPYGAVGYTYANNDIIGVRPCVNLRDDIEVTGDGRPVPTYTIASL